MEKICYASRPPPAKPALTAAFTLIEMSIVLVIIGLIVAGILLGQTLVRQAEIRSLISDVDNIRAAITTFQEKYNCLPGACINATDYWGTNPNCAAGTAGTGTKTCNGNGDGDINYGAQDTLDDSVAGNIEVFLFWQHLANAGLWGGSFTGVSAGGTNFTAMVGVNIPASRMSGGGGYAVADLMSKPYPGSFYATADYTRGMQFGANYPDGLNYTPVLTGAEMRALDTKIDDGLPGKGTVVTYSPLLYNQFSFPACGTGGDPATATYIVNDTVDCIPMFGKMWE